MYEVLATYLLYLLPFPRYDGTKTQVFNFYLKSDLNELKFYIEPDVKMNTSNLIFLKN